MAHLHIVVGPMFAGKSTFLINTIESLKTKSNSDEILIINHSSDKRYSTDSVICTHDNKKMPSLSLNKLKDLFYLSYDELSKFLSSRKFSGKYIFRKDYTLHEYMVYVFKK